MAEEGATGSEPMSTGEGSSDQWLADPQFRHKSVVVHDDSNFRAASVVTDLGEGYKKAEGGFACVFCSNSMVSGEATWTVSLEAPHAKVASKQQLVEKEVTTDGFAIGVVQDSIVHQLSNVGLGYIEEQWVYFPSKGVVACEGNEVMYGPQKQEETGKFFAFTQAGPVEFDEMPTKYVVKLNAAAGHLEFCGVDKLGTVTSFGPLPKSIEGENFRLACAVATTHLRVKLESGPGEAANAKDRVHQKSEAKPEEKKEKKKKGDKKDKKDKTKKKKILKPKGPALQSEEVTVCRENTRRPRCQQ
jgi:hypothetical protein